MAGRGGSARWLAGWAVGAALGLLTLTGAVAQQTFPVPSRFDVLADVPTQADYAALQAVVAAHPPWPPNGEGADFSRSSAAWITLGGLGRVLDVGFWCGSQNCPFALYTPAGGSFHLLFAGDGYIAGIAPSGGAVPDLVLGWAGCAGCKLQTDYRYNGSTFVKYGCTGAGPGLDYHHEVPQPCAPGQPVHAIPANPQRIEATADGVSPAEYAALQPFLEQQLTRLPAAARAAAVAAAHAVDEGVAIAVETGNCDALSNCPIWIVRQEGGAFNVILRDNGQAVGLDPAPGGGYETYVIRRATARGPELVEYASLWKSRLAAGARYSTPSLGPWAAVACEIVHGSTVTQVYCSDQQPVSAARTSSTDHTAVSAVLEDATGAIWAQPQGPGPLLRWQNGRWVPQPALAPEPGAMPPLVANMWPAPDGGVDARWAYPGSDVITWQRGNASKVLGRFPVANNIWGVIPTAAGPPLVETALGLPRTGDWAPGQQPSLEAMGADGRLHAVYTFSPRQLAPPLPLTPGIAPYMQELRATVDGRGDTWIWMPGPFHWIGGGHPGERLQGFLVDAGGRFAYHAAIPGLPAGAVSGVYRWDSRHLLAQIQDVGPFLIDVATATARPLAVPETGDFSNITDVFEEGGFRYVVADTPAAAVTIAGQSSLRANALWRWRDGHWGEVIAGLDPNPAVGPIYRPIARAHVATAQGLWVGALDGLWLIPSGNASEPRLFNSSEGLKVGGVGFLFRQPDQRLLAVAPPNPQHATASLAIAALMEPPARVAGVTTLPKGEVLVPGPDHHLWSLSNGSLKEWTGSAWLPHPLPPGLPPATENAANLAVDTAGWVWILPGCYMSPTMVYISTVEHWQALGNYLFALSRLPRQVVFTEPLYRRTPVYGPHGQIAVWGECNGVSYFSGSGWHVFNEGALPGQPNTLPVTAPYFDASGNLALNMSPDQSWEWTGSGWQQTKFESRPAAPDQAPGTRPGPVLGPPPGNCETTFPDSMITDRLGRTWWTSEGNLYEGTASQCRRVLSAAQAQPFADGRQLTRALVDSAGNVFFQTDLDGLQMVEVPAALAAAPAK